MNLADDVARVEDGLDALKQYESEDDVVVGRPFVDVTLRTLPPRHVRAAAVERLSSVRADSMPATIKRQALRRQSQLIPTFRRVRARAISAAARATLTLRGLTRNARAAAPNLISPTYPPMMSFGRSLRRLSKAVPPRTRAVLSKRAKPPVVIGFACGVALGGVVMQLLTAPTAEGTPPGPFVPITAEPTQPPALAVATTLVAETGDVETTALPPPPSLRPAAPSRPRYQGSLRINSQPASATVFVNNKVVGQTPLVLSSLAVGSRAVRLELSGYAPWSRSVQVVANQSANVTARLETAR